MEMKTSILRKCNLKEVQRVHNHSARTVSSSGFATVFYVIFLRTTTMEIISVSCSKI